MNDSLRLVVCICALVLGGAAQAQPGPPGPQRALLISDVSVFDGKSDGLREHLHVLVRGNRIAAVSTVKPKLSPGENVTVIEGAGRVLMPGLIDNHWHAMFVAASVEQVNFGDPALTTLIAAKEAAATLQRGFTSVRDMAGAVFGLKAAIDQGLIEGPRIWPSGAIISQTGGHGDFRPLADLPSSQSDKLPQYMQVGHAVVADGTAEVLRRSREQLMRGASQIKVAAGGGVISSFDPIDSAQYTLDELRAAVSAADNWRTYVTVHAYTPKAIQTAIAAGVRCIDHGHLMDEATARLMAENGVWLSAQPFGDDHSATTAHGSKDELVNQGTGNLYALARKYRIKTAFGTDILFNVRGGGQDQGKLLVSLSRWYSPAEVLKMATADNAELLALSGPRSPYPGKLGVIEEGALADLLLVNGNPLADLRLLADPQKNLALIVKDGRIVKQAL